MASEDQAHGVRAPARDGPLGDDRERVTPDAEAKAGRIVVQVAQWAEQHKAGRYGERESGASDDAPEPLRPGGEDGEDADPGQSAQPAASGSADCQPRAAHHRQSQPGPGPGVPAGSNA